MGSFAPFSCQESCGETKKKRTVKQQDKAVSYKKVDFDGAIRRSDRIKEKGALTESEL